MATLTKKQATPVMSIDSILLQRGKMSIERDEFSSLSNFPIAATVQSMLMRFGYMLTPNAYRALAEASADRVHEYYTNCLLFLEQAISDDKKYTPKYGAFPHKTVPQSMLEAITRVISIFSNDGWNKVTDKDLEDSGFERVTYTMVDVIPESEIGMVFRDLCSVNQSIMPQDMDVIKWFIANWAQERLTLPETIPFKENLCTLAALGLPVPVKTPTDVLRIAVHMSGGDISLPAVPAPTKQMRKGAYGFRGKFTTSQVANPERDTFKFRSFKRSERRYLLQLLESTGANEKEMVLKDQRWIRLGERLHPGEYVKQFPKSFAAFNAIRNTKVESWYSKLHKALYTNLDLKKALNIMTERPGEMARRLDWLVRTFSGSVGLIMEKFLFVVDKISNKVLYELHAHFSKRGEKVTGRKVFVKGARKPTPLPDLPALPPSLVKHVTDSIIDALKLKFVMLPSLGKVWVDPELFKIPLPTNMRSLNFTLKPTIRGQRVPMGKPDAKVIRAFFRWSDKMGEYDPDLSGTFVGKAGVKVLSYSGLRVGKSCHSGDIIRERGDNAEYIDIDVKDALDMGYKYVLMDVRFYSGHSLSDINGMFGFMERDVPQSSKTWLPETVANCTMCASSAQSTLLSIIDLETREYIFLDIDSSGAITATGDVQNTLDIIKAYSENPAISVGHLMTWHAEARGIQVLKKEDAETVFEFKDFCNDYIKTGTYMGV